MNIWQNVLNEIKIPVYCGRSTAVLRTRKVRMIKHETTKMLQLPFTTTRVGLFTIELSISFIKGLLWNGQSIPYLGKKIKRSGLVNWQNKIFSPSKHNAIQTRHVCVTLNALLIFFLNNIEIFTDDNIILVLYTVICFGFDFFVAYLVTFNIWDFLWGSQKIKKCYKSWSL